MKEKVARIIRASTIVTVFAIGYILISRFFPNFSFLAVPNWLALTIVRGLPLAFAGLVALAFNERIAPIIFERILGQELEEELFALDESHNEKNESRRLEDAIVNILMKAFDQRRAFPKDPKQKWSVAAPKSLGYRKFPPLRSSAELQRESQQKETDFPINRFVAWTRERPNLRGVVLYGGLILVSLFILALLLGKVPLS